MTLLVEMVFLESMLIDKWKSCVGRILCRWDYDPPSGHGQAQMGLQTQPGISCVTSPSQAPRWPFSHQIKSFLVKANVKYNQKISNLPLLMQTRFSITRIRLVCHVLPRLQKPLDSRHYSGSCWKQVSLTPRSKCKPTSTKATVPFQGKVQNFRSHCGSLQSRP